MKEMNIEVGQKVALVDGGTLFHSERGVLLISEVCGLTDAHILVSGYSGPIKIHRSTMKRTDAVQTLDLDWRKWLPHVSAHQLNFTRATHHLKCWPVFFQEVWDGLKPFEVRKNDRNFQTGDELVLEEWCPEVKGYLDRRIHAIVLYVLEGSEHLQPGFCAMGIRVTNKFQTK